MAPVRSPRRDEFTIKLLAFETQLQLRTESRNPGKRFRQREQHGQSPRGGIKLGVLGKKKKKDQPVGGHGGGREGRVGDVMSEARSHKAGV